MLPVEAVYGLGGVGKTALALEFAHRFASDYELIWWVAAEDPANAATGLAAIGRTAGHRRWTSTRPRRFRPCSTGCGPADGGC